MTADVVQIQLSTTSYDKVRSNKKREAALKRRARSVLRKRVDMWRSATFKWTSGNHHAELENLNQIASDYNLPLPDDVAFWLRLHRAYVRRQAMCEYVDLPLFQNGDPHGQT